ncbi:MAG: hypothetical protein U5K69_25835 [Balneolaceae bacterium]|nr:hypothetical protein [Balneolaceae bacterium]
MSIDNFFTRTLITGLLVGFLALFQPPTAEGQNVNEFVQVDSLKVGDTFTYTLTLDKNQAYDNILFPDSSHFGDPFEIRSRQHFKVTDFKDSLIYNLQFFGTEDTRLSALPVGLVNGNDTSTVYTNPVPVYFKTVLQAETEDFRPLKPIFDFARAWWPYLLAVIILAFAGWYLYRWYQAKKEEPAAEPKSTFKPAPFKNPLTQLEDEIEELHSYTFQNEEDFKQFYIHLGDAIRTYFEDLHDIPALESTSREIIYELESRMVNERMIKQTRKVLRQADMVKFAKFQPSKEQTRISLTIAEDFVEVARKNDKARIEQKRRTHQSEEEQRRQEVEEKFESKEPQNV